VERSAQLFSERADIYVVRMNPTKWKCIFGSLMAVGGLAFYARLILLEVWAHDGAGHLHLAQTGAWNVREQYGSVIFYITQRQEWWADILEYVFFADLIVLFILLIVSGSFRRAIQS
jgi:hypothetical protein